MSVCSIFRGIIEANAHTDPDPTLQDAGNKASSSLAAVNFGIDLRGNVGICIHTIPNSKYDVALDPHPNPNSHRPRCDSEDERTITPAKL